MIYYTMYLYMQKYSEYNIIIITSSVRRLSWITLMCKNKDNAEMLVYL